MGNKKSGYSKKSKDFWGRPVKEHFNSKGEKTGYSKESKDFWGKRTTERYNSKGEKTGYAKETKNFWGNSRTERFNNKGEKVGHNERSQTFWGTPITERYNEKGEKTGYSKKGTTFWGTPITEHYNDPRSVESRSPYPQSQSSAVETSNPQAESSKSRSVFIGIAIVVVFLVATSDGFKSWLSNVLQPTSETARTNPTNHGPRPGYPGRLLPVDEAPSDPSFMQFRTNLLSAIARKDFTFLRSVLSPNIEVGFGGDPNTADQFARMWHIESPQSQLWSQLGQVLRMGGSFSVRGGERVFCAPYVTSAWPQGADPFYSIAVTGDNVPLRRSPGTASPSVAMLSYDILKFRDWTKDRQWAQVTTKDGKTGFVNHKYLRTAIDLRAFFKLVNGTWTMTAFVAGD